MTETTTISVDVSLHLYDEMGEGLETTFIAVRCCKGQSGMVNIGQRFL